MLAIIGLSLLAWVVYLSRLEGRFEVKRSLEIEAPLSSVFTAIVDLKSWPRWSPWLLHESEAKITFSGTYGQQGSFYEWSGQVVGAGKMTHLEINQGNSIRQQLDFLRPFKSRNQVTWKFEPQGERTLVSWSMSGRMPFIFRTMTAQMEPMIGRDYDLGLARLNGYLNSANPHPRLEFNGQESLDSFIYWAIPFQGKLRQLETARPVNVAALQKATAVADGLSLTIYYRLNPFDTEFQAEIATPISEGTPSSNYTRRQFTGGEYYKLTLQGDHRFLPMAWNTLFSHCRMHKIKIDKTRPALEIYHHDPAIVADSNQITTALYLAIR